MLDNRALGYVRSQTVAEERPTDEGALRISEPRGDVRVFTLNRPHRLNALTWDLVDLIRAGLRDVGREPRIRTVIVTGAGRGFCSGLDLKESADPIGSDDDVLEFLRRQEGLAALVTEIRSLPVPVIAAINGPAAGGGFALALACDLRICTDTARFTTAFMQVGLSAGDMGVSYILPRLVGLGSASELMLTGRRIDASEALRIGLVNHVVADDALMPAALELAGEVAANSPFAVRMSKEVLAFGVDSPSLDATLALENRTQAVASRTAEQRESFAAFLEKRTARFATTTGP
jgi:enoyl-CoA hydratase